MGVSIFCEKARWRKSTTVYLDNCWCLEMELVTQPYFPYTLISLHLHPKTARNYCRSKFVLSNPHSGREVTYGEFFPSRPAFGTSLFHWDQ